MFAAGLFLRKAIQARSAHIESGREIPFVPDKLFRSSADHVRNI
jgi:hypothetical protein